MKRGLPLSLLLCLVLAVWLPSRPALARSTSLMSYPASEVWPAAVRFLRIDRDCPIREKDEEAGYILFELVEGSKSHKGSVELIRTTDREGRDATRVVLSIPDLPRHYEQLLLDKLAAKLREERGSPAPGAQGKSEPKPLADAGVR